MWGWLDDIHDEPDAKFEPETHGPTEPTMTLIEWFKSPEVPGAIIFGLLLLICSLLLGQCPDPLSPV